jgi:rhodanese-related sulfurtransferase
MPDDIRIEREDDIATVVLDRPDKHRSPGRRTTNASTASTPRASGPATQSFSRSRRRASPVAEMSGHSATSPDAAGADDAAADTAELLARAAERGRSRMLPYHGELLPAEAWALLRAGAASLIDVRTLAEWTYVGRVDGAPLVEWRAFGAQQPNADFIAQLAAQAPRDRPVLFLCRSGVRSHAAAQLATASGWTTAINVLEGFEGELDADGRRGAVGGWRKAGLPWVQS